MITMVDINDVFNTSGKFPTEADFWAGSVEDFVSAGGITAGFSQVIAEQTFRPIDDPLTPFYRTFAGRPIESGMGWTERVLGKTRARKFNPKATAEDALGFYDSEGIERTFTVDYSGWLPVSLPSSLASIEQFVSRNGVGQLNSLLVDNVLASYQRAMESAIALKAISTTSKSVTLTAEESGDPQAILKKIQTLATAFRGTKTPYNELETEEQEKVYTNSRDVLVFMSQQLLDNILDSFAVLPSPDRIVRNAEIIPLVDGLPSPLTTAQFNEGVKEGAKTVTTWTPATKPVAIDQPAPLVWMCARDRVEYRPLMGSYRVNLQRNGAGDFDNEHLVWSGAIAIRPWENAVRINASE